MAEEEAARVAAEKAAEEEAARVAEAEAAEMTEQVAEIERLNKQTNELWKQGQQTNWESMSHTEAGSLKMELKNRARIHQNFMHSMVTASTHNLNRPQNTVVKQSPVSTNHNVKMFNSGMMFGRYR